MSTFTIDTENNITAHAELPAGADESQSFSSAKDLAKLTAEWPVSRLVETWNSFAGVAPFDELKPQKKFTSRKTAVARIWEAVQRLSPDGAQRAADVAPAKGKAKKSPTKTPRCARAQKDAAEARSNKKAEVMAMMKRAKGATLAEITEATGWHMSRTRRGHLRPSWIEANQENQNPEKEPLHGRAGKIVCSLASHTLIFNLVAAQESDLPVKWRGKAPVPRCPVPLITTFRLKQRRLHPL